MFLSHSVLVYALNTERSMSESLQIYASTTSPSPISGGIRFTCVDCGQCCTGAPGTVRMTEDEVRALAAYLGDTPEGIRRKHLAPEGSGWRIKEQFNGDCVFFDKRCTIYPVRPGQCRTYPFWFKNLRSINAWKRTAAACPGIGQGRLYGEEEILALVHEDMETLSDHESDIPGGHYPGCDRTPSHPVEENTRK